LWFRCMLALEAVALLFIVSGMVGSSLMFGFRQTSLSIAPKGAARPATESF